MNQNVRTTDAVTFSTVDTGQGATEVHLMNQNIRTTDNVTHNQIISTTGVYAAGANGFYSSTYASGRNPIWRFANADAYGLSYFQGAGGYTSGVDMIGMHFGTATVAGSQFSFIQDGRFIASSTISAAGITSTGDITISNTYPRINLTDTNNDSDYSIINADGAFTIYDVTNASNRLVLSNTGVLTYRGLMGGTAGSAVAAFNKNVIIGSSAYNQTWNSGNAVILQIEGYSNDGGDVVYPIYAEDENNIVDFYLNAGNNQTIDTKTAYIAGMTGIGTSPDLSYRLKVGGIGYATTDFRAPIFKDSDNTGYYTDPASTSNINNLTINGNLNITSNNPPTYYESSNGGYSRIYKWGTDIGYQDYTWKYLLLFVRPTSGTGEAQTSIDGWFTFHRTNGLGCSVSFKVFAQRGWDTSVYSNLISYGANTPQMCYVVDGGQTWLAVKWYEAPNTHIGNGEFLVTSADHSKVSLKVIKNTSDISTSYTGGYNSTQMSQALSVGGSVTSTGVMDATQFRDYDNTGYYADFASTGTSINIAGSVNAATYNKAGLLLNSSGTGASGAAFGMQQVTGEGWTGIFVDYEPYTGWGLYHDNPSNYFLITSEGSTGAIGGGFAVPSRSSGNRTAYTKHRFDQNNGDMTIGRDGYAQTSWRAPSIYHDYWYDQGGTFVARVGSGTGTTRHINLSNSTTDPSSASVDSGISWGARSDGNPYYIIYARPQNYNGNYNKLTIAWHTGIHIGAESYYGGTRIYNNSPAMSATEIASFGRGDNYVRSEYGVLSPAFYDISDTGYFVDPSVNGTGARIYGMTRFGGWGGGNYNENIRLVDAGNNHSVITFGASGDAGVGRFQFLKNNTDVLELRPVNQSTVWYWDQSGIAYSTTSVRAPIFYDRDNTAYYVNPDGFSNFGQSNGQVVTITKTGSAPGNNSTMLVTNSYGNHSWGITGEFRIEANGGADRPSILFSNGFDSQTWSCGYGYNDSGYFRINHDHGHRNGSWGTIDWYVDRSGNSFAVGSSRAPIFYDSDNTGYYLNPNATFNLNLNSGGVTFNGDTSGIHVLNAEGVSSNVRVGAAWGRPGVYNSPYFCIGAESFIEFRIGNVQNGFVESSYLQMAGSARAPLFYDSNDTYYFVDPNGSSRTNEFLARKMRGDTNGIYTDNSGWWTHDPYGQGWGKPFGSFRSLEVSTSGNFSTEPAMFRIHQWGSGSCEWWKPQGTTVYLRETPGGGGSWFTRYVIERYAENNESFRAPIFYDTNNTGYYIDPNGFTEIYGGLRMSGAHGSTTIRNRLLASNNGAGTGLVHMQWWCSEPGNTWDWGGFGYNVDQTYHDGSGPYYFSRPNTSFGSAYFRFSTAGNVYLNTMNSGGSNWRVMEWYIGGTVLANDYLTGGNSLRAPIFYDSNDTYYFIDGNGSSRTNEFLARKMRGDTNGIYSDNNGWWTHDPYGQGWGKPHGSFRSLEVSTSGNFSTEPAMFRIHQWGSGSCEWWKPQGTTVYLRETPGGGGSWFTRYVIERYAENNESFRAPIFYDTNDTSYYYDGTGNSRSADHRFSRIGFPGSGIGGDGFPYARIVEAWGVAFAPSDARWAPNVYNASFLVGFYSSGTNFGSGNILATGNITAYYSDERLKDIISVIPNALDKVMTLRGFYYTNNELAKENGYTDEKVQLGVSAQEVEAVLPEIVTLAPFDMCGDNDPINGDGKLYSKSGQHYKTVDYSRLTPLLIEAIKELKGELDIARAEIKELREEISKK